MHSIAKECNYQGLIQVDFIETREGDLFLLEINPRWTASMELIELVTGRNLFLDHCFACSNEQMDFGLMVDDVYRFKSNTVLLKNNLSNAIWAGKRICYASKPLEVDQTMSDFLFDRNRFREESNHLGRYWYRWADIPRPGVRIESMEPIATFIACGYQDGQANEAPFAQSLFSAMSDIAVRDLEGGLGIIV